MSDEPLAVQAEVVHERGAWSVYLEFWHATGVERKHVATYPNEAAACLATRWFVWTARRDVHPPDGLNPRDVPT